MTENSKRRYITVVATVAVPNDDVWDQIIANAVSDAIRTYVGSTSDTLVPCDWSPDADTIADGVGAEYGTVSVVDLNPGWVDRAEEDPRLLGPDGYPCEGCEGSSGLPPVSSMGYCLACYQAAWSTCTPEDAEVYVGIIEN